MIWQNFVSIASFFLCIVKENSFENNSQRPLEPPPMFRMDGPNMLPRNMPPRNMPPRGPSGPGLHGFGGGPRWNRPNDREREFDFMDAKRRRY